MAFVAPNSTLSAAVIGFAENFAIAENVAILRENGNVFFAAEADLTMARTKNFFLNNINIADVGYVF